MAVVGCYSMHLYCDTGGDPYGGTCPSHVPGATQMTEFTSHTHSQCIRQAKDRGWTFNRDKTKAFCPKCSAARRG